MDVLKRYEEINKGDKNMKKIVGIILALVLCLGLTGCGSNSSNKDSGGSHDVSGTIALNGSTSMEKYVTALVEAIKEEYPNLTLAPQFTGSSDGLEAVASGTADIGNSSRELKDAEKEKGLVENVVAIDGIAIVTHKNNSIKDLTKEQLAKIYTGEITNWKEVGGDDQAIVVIGREAGSGTRGAFEEILKIEDACKYGQELNQTGAVMAAVASIDGAIGYVSLDVIDDSVKALQLDGIPPSEATVKDGSYTLQRPFVMATKGEIKDQNTNIKAMFDFIESEAGQEVLKSVGLVSPK